MKTSFVVPLISYVVRLTIVGAVALPSCFIAPMFGFVALKVVFLTRFGVTIFAASFVRRRLTSIPASRSSSSSSHSSSPSWMKIAETRTGRR